MEYGGYESSEINKVVNKVHFEVSKGSAISLVL